MLYFLYLFKLHQCNIEINAMIGNSVGVKSDRRVCQLNGDLMPNSRQNAFDLIISQYQLSFLM